MTKTVREESNVAAIRDALTYCMAMIRELEQMKLMPIVNVEAIEKMKTGILILTYIGNMRAKGSFLKLTPILDLLCRQI